MEDTSFKVARPTHWRMLFKFSIGAIVFWLLEFVAQYHWLQKGDLANSLVVSFAFAGATLIGLALFSSAIFKWYPRTAQYWRFRRYLGVSGFIFALLHSQTALYFVFGYSLVDAYPTFNPFENPVVFGTFALFILLIMASISTDWAVTAIGPRRWKFIHRFIYVAYPSAVFHFLIIDPEGIKTPPGYLLLLVTVAALFGQLFWFFKISARRRFRSLGFLIGSIIILAVLISGYVVWF